MPRVPVLANSIPPKYVVAQIGARRGYAVPNILASNGMLARFYTDVSGNLGLGRAVSLAASMSPALQRLSNRHVPDSIAPLTTTFPLRTAAYHCRESFTRDHLSRYRANLEWQSALGRAAARLG